MALRDKVTLRRVFERGGSVRIGEKLITDAKEFDAAYDEEVAKPEVRVDKGSAPNAGNALVLAKENAELKARLLELENEKLQKHLDESKKKAEPQKP